MVVKYSYSQQNLRRYGRMLGDAGDSSLDNPGMAGDSSSIAKEYQSRYCAVLADSHSDLVAAKCYCLMSACPLESQSRMDYPLEIEHIHPELCCLLSYLFPPYCLTSSQRSNWDVAVPILVKLPLMLQQEVDFAMSWPSSR